MLEWPVSSGSIIGTSSAKPARTSATRSPNTRDSLPRAPPSPASRWEETYTPNCRRWYSRCRKLRSSASAPFSVPKSGWSTTPLPVRSFTILESTRRSSSNVVGFVIAARGSSSLIVFIPGLNSFLRPTTIHFTSGRSSLGTRTDVTAFSPRHTRIWSAQCTIISPADIDPHCGALSGLSVLIRASRASGLMLGEVFAIPGSA